MAFSGDVLLPVGQWVDIRAACIEKGANWTVDTAILVQNKTRTLVYLISRDSMPAPGTRLALTGLTALIGMALGTGDQLTAHYPPGGTSWCG